MGRILTLAVRIALLVAICIAWGWLAALIAVVATIIITPKKTFWRDINYSSARTIMGIILKTAVFVVGLIAAEMVWGYIWVVILLIIYVLALMDY